MSANLARHASASALTGLRTILWGACCQGRYSMQPQAAEICGGCTGGGGLINTKRHLRRLEQCATGAACQAGVLLPEDAEHPVCRQQYTASLSMQALLERRLTAMMVASQHSMAWLRN